MKRYAANLDTTQWKTERRYAYDGVNVVADSGRGDSSWTWHVFQGYNRLALADKPGSTLRVKYLLNDHLGTANVMVDDTGRVLAKYARDPWGNLESSWESAPLRWQFTGKEQDPEVGGNVFYFNARFYDAERGSFIGRDPKLQFWTPYSYVGNRSLLGGDPTGQEIGYGGEVDQVQESKALVKQIQSTPRGAEIIEALQCADAYFEVRQIVTSYATNQTVSYTPSSKIIKYDPFTLIMSPTEGGLMPFAPVIQISHEFGHAFDDIRGLLDVEGYATDPNLKMEIEVRNIRENENPIRESLGFPRRLESERGYKAYGR